MLEEKTNFYAIRTDCRAILNLWKQRFLSLAGKIQIFKSLIASKPVYLATMKHLPQEILDDLQSMHKDFIWDGKRAKIKHCTLIGDYTDGGLKDADLASKFTSLKFIWIKKMLDTKNFHPWVAVADNILRKVGGVNVFQSNLSVAPSRLNSFKRIPVFYKELIDVWKTFSGGVVKDVEFILSQSLWNNKFIASKNDTLYSEELYCKEIKYVSDLIDDEGCLSAWEVKSEKFDLSANAFLTWYGVIQSIPTEWKNIIRDANFSVESYSQEAMINYRHGIFIGDNFYGITNVKTSMIYNALVQKRFVPPTSRNKLSQKFDISDEDWPKIYSLAGKCSIDSKTRIFQYKILNNALYLNKRLFRCKLAESPLCSMCGVEDETVIRLFSECRYSTKLWEELQNASASKLSLPNVSPPNVILGIIDCQSSSVAINHLLLIYKRYIYICRMEAKSISFRGFKCFLQNIISIKKKIAGKNNTLHVHYKKWNFLFDIL